jgi:hypothetical protein
MAIRWKSLATFGVLGVLGMIVSAQAGGEKVSLIGMDETGNPIELVLDKKDYADRVQAVTAAVSESTLGAMNRKSLQEKWALRTVLVGVGVGLEAGFGPIIKVKVLPRFRLAFSNSTDPALP